MQSKHSQQKPSGCPSYQRKLNMTQEIQTSTMTAVAFPTQSSQSQTPKATELPPTTVNAQTPPWNPTSTPILTSSLTAEQETAVQKLLEFIADPEPKEPFFVLSGFAGTGKTFCMREVTRRCQSSKVNFAFTAPTNKAAKVLRAITGDACTIYSLLGLRIDKDGEVKKLMTSSKPIDLSDIDVIFIDEASMVNSRLMELLVDASNLHLVKIVFMGDAAQLPPIGEVASNVWKLHQGAELHQVMRHDNQILQLVTNIREALQHFLPSIIIRSDHTENEGVWKISNAVFKQTLYNLAQDGEFADGTHAKVIAWRNARVAEYNNLIRNAIFGNAAVPGYYLQGERIIAASPCKVGEDIVLATDEEGIVEGTVESKHPVQPKYKILSLKIRTEMNRVIRLTVLHPESKQAYDNDCQSLAHEASSNPKMWKKFWNLKELFHEIRYAYAITAHRAQGSTYHTVFVDSVDILMNRNRKEAFQCLYVACSRPTTKLILC